MTTWLPQSSGWNHVNDTANVHVDVTVTWGEWTLTYDRPNWFARLLYRWPFYHVLAFSSDSWQWRFWAWLNRHIGLCDCGEWRNPECREWWELP